MAIEPLPAGRLGGGARPVALVTVAFALGLVLLLLLTRAELQQAAASAALRERAAEQRGLLHHRLEEVLLGAGGAGEGGKVRPAGGSPPPLVAAAPTAAMQALLAAQAELLPRLETAAGAVAAARGEAARAPAVAELLLLRDRFDEAAHRLLALEREHRMARAATLRRLQIGVVLAVVLFAAAMAAVAARAQALLAAADQERACAEAALRGSQEQAEDMLDHAGAAFLTIDPESVITGWNARAEQLFGWSRAEVLGRSLIDTCVPERHRQAHRRGLQRYLDGEPPTSLDRRLELSALHRSGTEFPVEVTLTSLPGPGRAVFSALIQDIGERKRNEEALARAHHELARAHELLEARVAERTAELTRANRDLEVLLNVTSHDLKEPLRSIENFSQLLAERWGERLEPAGRDLLDRVQRSGSRMRQLLADIRLLTRVRRLGSMTVSDVSGEAVVDEALQRLEREVKESGADVRVVEPLPRLRLARVWAVEAMYNLLANAIKFTPSGQAPEIEVRAYEPGPGEPPAPGLVVADRGPGVLPEQSERIFELFQRGVGREVAGTGAGLAIVREVALGHGGAAWVRPRPGGGSEFVIVFKDPPPGQRRARASERAGPDD